jgi:Ankyrin repeats (3 copies)
MEYTKTTMASAARYDKLAEVQYLHSQGCPWPSYRLVEAASSGHSELVRWCYEHGCPWNANRVLHHAAESGNVELMAWVLLQPGTQLFQAVMAAAASKGHTAMCQYLHAQQCSWDFTSTCRAARYGHVALLRWIVDSGCPWDALGLCSSALEGDSVEVLTYMQQVGLLAGTALLMNMLNSAARCNMLVVVHR